LTVGGSPGAREEDTGPRRLGKIWVSDLQKAEQNRAVGGLNGPIKVNEINSL
jgi:hypothetical protein